MEESGGFVHRNPKYLIGGMNNERAFANAGGNSEEELRQGLELIARSTGGVVPSLERADIYVKLENGVVSPRTGFDITIPEDA